MPIYKVGTVFAPVERRKGGKTESAEQAPGVTNEDRKGSQSVGRKQQRRVLGRQREDVAEHLPSMLSTYLHCREKMSSVTKGAEAGRLCYESHMLNSSISVNIFIYAF